MKKGDIVILQEDNVKRGQWKVEIVEEIILEKDGEPRGATVRKYEIGKPVTLNRPFNNFALWRFRATITRVRRRERNSLQGRIISTMLGR